MSQLFPRMTASGASLPSLSQRYYSKRQYAHGQGASNEKALGRAHRKFLVIPPGIDDIASRILDELDIEVVEFSRHGSGYTFAWPDEL
ncbi:hypothetical protein [Rhizobium laguerreae]|uniref:hypothetical protein n=1 Tax=Rhizobium laguerreae TaxID=1076926 RepID=UPI001C90E921|nr:hypothetical protein [Rhizobium laguerreae]MBY3168178.1 hypothetical protein [Rhizobium laguerreae]